MNAVNWVFSVMQYVSQNDIALACYIFDIHQPILIYDKTHDARNMLL